MTTPKRLRAYATELQDLSEVMSEVARLLDAVQAARPARVRRKPASDSSGHSSFSRKEMSP